MRSISISSASILQSLILCVFSVPLVSFWEEYVLIKLNWAHICAEGDPGVNGAI